MRSMTDAVHEWPLGVRVLQARGEESARSVAKRAKVSPEVLWQIENGRRRDGAAFTRPKASTVEQVARALDIPVSEALELAGYKPDHYVKPSEGRGASLARKAEKLEDREFRAVEILVDSILISRGYMSAAPTGLDVVVHSAGEEVHPVVQSHGESVSDDTVKQSQRD